MLIAYASVCSYIGSEQPVFRLGVRKLPITRQYISHEHIDEINTETWPSRMCLVLTRIAKALFSHATNLQY